MAKTVKKNAAKTVWIFFIVVILAVILALIVTSLVFKNPDVTPSAFGYSAFIMDEDGMGAKVPKGSLVLAKNYSPSADNLGDAILCEGVKDHGTTVIRLSNIVPDTKTVVYQGFYDSDKETVYSVPSDKLIGKAVSYNMALGHIISFVTSFKGRAVLVVIPILMLLVCEAMIGLYSKNSRSKSKKKRPQRRPAVAADGPLVAGIGDGKLSHTMPMTIDDYIFGNKGDEKAKKEAEDAAKAAKQGKKRPEKQPPARSGARPPMPRKPQGSAQQQRPVRAEADRRNTKPAGAMAQAGRTAPTGATPAGRTAPTGATPAGRTVPTGATPAGRTAPAGAAPAGRTAPSGAVPAGRTAPTGAMAQAGQQIRQPQQVPQAQQVQKPQVPQGKAQAQQVPQAQQGQQVQQPIECECEAAIASNKSLARLIKLMEEQEKLLKESSDTD